MIKTFMDQKIKEENAFYKKDFGSYWFASGTPTFLIEKLNAVNFDARKFIDTVKVSEADLSDYRPENPDPVPLFYQSGYLTIKDWNLRQRSYKLGFPNAEVQYECTCSNISQSSR